MIPKIECCIEALRGGVKQAHVIDGRVKHALLLEVLTNQGVGTEVRTRATRRERAPAAGSRAHDRTPRSSPATPRTSSASTRASRWPSRAAQGCELWDADGKRYLDFFAGVAVNSLGHCHPAVVEAIRAPGRRAAARLEPLPHRARGRAGRAALPALVRRARVPLQQRRRGDRGRDEAGAPLGRRARRRALRDPRHARARSTAAPSAPLTATGQEKYHQGFLPAAPRRPARARSTTSRRWRRAIAPETIAIMVEPIQGEGGVVVPRRATCAACARSPTGATSC